jgi:hypothetical protein
MEEKANLVPEAEEDSPEFQLGDGVYIAGGRLDGTRGRIYYMDDERIRILPMGASDRLIEIPLVDGDLDPSLGITNFWQTSARAQPAFVSQIDAHVDQIAETFGMNGEPGIQYTIKEINEEEDTITLVDETGGEKKIEFNFVGIPIDEGFAVLRPRQAPLPQNNGEGAPPEELPTEEEVDVFGEIGANVEEENAGLVERPATQRVYPDIVQRNDMFQNLLELLDIASQKNVKRQRDTRQLVEQLLLLRNEIVKYDAAGEPDGKHLTSFQTIGELLEHGDIPLARPVLQASRSIYLDKVQDGDNPIELPDIDIDIHYLRDVVDDSNEFLDTQLGGTAGQLVVTDALPQWFTSWENFYKRFMRSWISEGGTGETVTFRGDKEFLRAPVPDGKEPATDGLPAFGEGGSDADIKWIDKKFISTASLVGKVRLSLMKGLGPRTTRLKEKEAPRRIETADEGIIVNQLLFPLEAQRNLGLSRSGQLKKDIAFSHAKPKGMLGILNDLGGIPEEATAGGIISIGDGGNTSGNIAIEDWLKVQPIHIRGLGDALIELKNLGLTQKELSSDQQLILVDKVKQFRALLKQYITTERELSAKAVADLRLENLPFLQGEALEDVMVTLESEPLIQARIGELRARTPAYKDNDMALIAGISTEMSDLLLTVFAGVPAPLARERNRRVRDNFLEALRQALLKAEKKAEAGEIPTPVKCPHTDSLNAIRKVKDNDERMQLLARMLARFRGVTKDNWIKCSASPANAPHNLMCYHEFLQLQEYLHPREKDTIHKELLLAFSGGSFHGRFMCKNCGQAISEMEFDQSMEFDDNGRPMANRAALVDAAAVAEEELYAIIGTSDGNEEANFAGDTQPIVYKAARQIFDKLGIYAELDCFKRIVQRVESDIQKQPSREEYAKMLKAKKGEGRQLDYDVLINRLLVSSTGAHCLIEIQTHVPDFVLRYKIPGCVAGFSGFPMGKEDDKTGINYMSCAVASITSSERPWSLTGFLTIGDKKKRQEAIATGIQKMAADALKTAIVQQMISVKRAHYEKIYGKAIISDGVPELVPAGFRPVPYFVKPEEAAEAVIIPEAAGPLDLARAWIQTGHKVARENGEYVSGSPYVEASCCYTPISEPRGFWAAKEDVLPKLSAKTPPRGQASSQVMLRFTPRRNVKILSDPPEDLFYRVFLRVCYDGPRKGLPHEPGYTNICPHCGFTFPDNPYMISPGPPLTKDLFKEWQSEMDSIITKGKSALESQKIVVDRGTFENVLDAAHTRFHVDMPERVQPVTGTALLSKIAALEPEPFEGFRILMAETITRASSLTGGAEEMAVAQAYSPLSDNMIEVLGEIQKRVGMPAVKTLQALIKQSPSQIVESIRTYFLVPFQRLILKFKPNSLKVQKSYKLPIITEEDVNASLESHLVYLDSLQKLVKGYAEIKLTQAQRQLSSLLRIIQNEVRRNMIPGGELGTGYLVAALVIGVLGEFINPNVVPTGVSGTGGAVETTSRVPINILEVCLSRLQLEGLNFTEDEIRDLIARRTAAEKDLFTTGQNKMTPEEKKADLMMKRLGLGKWAVGGTKAVYTLDPDQLDREREQRIEMGLGDFAMDPEAAAHANALIQDDMYGGGGVGAEGGYDVDEIGADDW